MNAALLFSCILPFQTYLCSLSLLFSSLPFSLLRNSCPECWKRKTFEYIVSRGKAKNGFLHCFAWLVNVILPHSVAKAKLICPPVKRLDHEICTLKEKMKQEVEEERRKQGQQGEVPAESIDLSMARGSVPGCQGWSPSPLASGRHPFPPCLILHWLHLV